MPGNEQYNKLTKILDEMVTHYRKMLDIVRKEKELLIEAKIDDLILNNEEKSLLVQKISAIDSRRINAALELGIQLKLDNPAPRLTELAHSMRGTPESEVLRKFQATLSLLFERVKIQNEQNEEYTKSALRNINGALDNIKETLSGKKTYEKRGQYKMGPETAGNFVSKEA